MLRLFFEFISRGSSENVRRFHGFKHKTTLAGVFLLFISVLCFNAGKYDDGLTNLFSGFGLLFATSK